MALNNAPRFISDEVALSLPFLGNGASFVSQNSEYLAALARSRTSQGFSSSSAFKGMLPGEPHRSAPVISSISSDFGGTTLGDSNHSMDRSVDSYLSNLQSIFKARQQEVSLRRSLDSHLLNTYASIIRARRKQQEDLRLVASVGGGDRNGPVLSMEDAARLIEANVRGRRRRGGENAPLKKRTKWAKARKVDFDPAPERKLKPEYQHQPIMSREGVETQTKLMKDVDFDPAPEHTPGRQRRVSYEEDADVVRNLMSLRRGAAPGGKWRRDDADGRDDDAGASWETSPAEALQLQRLAASIVRSSRSRQRLMDARLPPPTEVLIPVTAPWA